MRSVAGLSFLTVEVRDYVARSPIAADRLSVSHVAERSIIHQLHCRKRLLSCRRRFWFIAVPKAAILASKARDLLCGDSARKCLGVVLNCMSSRRLRASSTLQQQNAGNRGKNGGAVGGAGSN